MFGKNTYIWNIEAIFEGDTEKIAAELKAAGFESVILHSSRLSTWRTNKRLELVMDLKAAGITVIGGAAVYGFDPKGEGIQAAEICTDYGLAAFVFDAESTWDTHPEADSNAVHLIKTFREYAPGVKVGWCWWARYKSPISGSEWHPENVLWAAMAPDYGDADFGLPMAYWWDKAPANALLLLEQTLSQWREVTDKPLVPIGRAYNGDGGEATPDAMTAFYEECKAEGCDGVSWWVMDQAVRLPGIWDALKVLQPFEIELPEPEEPPTEEPEMTWTNNALLLFTQDKVEPADLEGYAGLVAEINDNFTHNVQSAYDAEIPCILFANHEITSDDVNYGLNPDLWNKNIETHPLIKELDRYIYSGDVKRVIHGIMINCQYVTDETKEPLTVNWWADRNRWILNTIYSRYELLIYPYMNRDPKIEYADDIEPVYKLCKNFGVSVVDFTDGYEFPLPERQPWRPYIGEEYAWYFWLYRWAPGAFLYNGTPEELYSELNYEAYPQYPPEDDPPEDDDPPPTELAEVWKAIQVLQTENEGQQLAIDAFKTWKNKPL